MLKPIIILKYDSIKKANPQLFLPKEGNKLIQINLNPEEVQEQKNPVMYILNLYKNDTTDLFITSGRFIPKNFINFRQKH